MNLLPSLLLLAFPLQDWSAHQLPSLSIAPAHAQGPQILATGSHIALVRDPATGSRYQEAFLAPSLLNQLISGHFNRSNLSLVPGSNPLLVRATPKEHQELRAILSALEEASARLQIRLHVMILPGLPESIPIDATQAGDSSTPNPDPTFRGELRSGDTIVFGLRTDRHFVGGYEIDVATDSGVADPHRSSALHGETVHLTCSRVQGGRAVHVEGLLDLARLESVTTFDPDTPDLGELEQPRISICQIAFSGIATADEPVRVVIRGSQTFGDKTLFISASTLEDIQAPTTGWAVRDLSFLASKGLPLTAPEPGLRPYSASKANFPPTHSPTTPGSVVGLLTERSSLGTETGRIHSTERLLLIPVGAPAAISRTDELVEAMESPLLAEETCSVRFGETSVELSTTYGRLARVLIGQEQPWLVDYQTEIAQSTWMPSPVSEVAFDGACIEGRSSGGVFHARWWVASTPAVHIADRGVASIGALQHVERTFAAGNERLVRGSSRVISGPDTPLELHLK